MQQETYQMNTNSEARNLTETEVDAVMGAALSDYYGTCRVVADNPWLQWMSDKYNFSP
jgi:hypothetical protein